MGEDTIQVIHSQFTPIAVQHLKGFLGCAGHFGLDEQLLARQTLDGVAHQLVRVVTLRRVDVSDAVVVTVSNQPVESVPAEVALNLAAIGAGADAEPAQFDAGFAERNLVGNGALWPGRPE
jgi:hypothetical protein